MEFTYIGKPWPSSPSLKSTRLEYSMATSSSVFQNIAMCYPRKTLPVLPYLTRKFHFNGYLCNSKHIPILFAKPFHYEYVLRQL